MQHPYAWHTPPIGMNCDVPCLSRAFVHVSRSGITGVVPGWQLSFERGILIFIQDNLLFGTAHIAITTLLQRGDPWSSSQLSLYALQRHSTIALCAPQDYL